MTFTLNFSPEKLTKDPWDVTLYVKTSRLLYDHDGVLYDPSVQEYTPIGGKLAVVLLSSDEIVNPGGYYVRWNKTMDFVYVPSQISGAEVDLVDFIDEPATPPEDPSSAVPPGGGSNQVLGKRSAADYDTVWVNQTGGGASYDDTQVKQSIANHVARTDNPHAVTKAQLGLGSTDNVSAASLRDRATHTGLQAPNTISDLAEFIQDTVGSMLVSGGAITLSYDDANNRLTVNAPIDSETDAEVVRDTIGAALVGVQGITVGVNDAADTITLGITGLTISQVTGLQAALDSNANSISTHVNRTDNPHQATAAQVGAVALTGDTMTGPLALSGDPVSALHATTRQWVLTQFGGYAPLIMSAHVVSAAGNAQAIPSPSSTVGYVHQYYLNQSTCAFTLPSGLLDRAGVAGQVDLVLYLTNSGGGARDHTWPASVTWDSNGKPTVPTTANGTLVVTLTTMDGGNSWLGAGPGAGYSDEQAQDATAALFAAGTHTGITFSYDDTNNKLSATVTATGSSYTDEQAQDAVAALIAAGTHSGIAFAYDDTNNKLSATVDSAAYPLSWQPADNFMVASNAMPSAVSSQTITVTNTNYTLKMRIRKNTLVTGVVLFVGVAGAAASGFYAALHDNSGALLAQTGDLGTLAATGDFRYPFLATTTISADQQVYVTIHSGTATTYPRFGIAGNTGYMNSGLGTGVAPSAANAPRVSIPANTWTGSSAPATLGSLSTTGGAVGYFAGLY